MVLGPTTSAPAPAAADVSWAEGDVPPPVPAGPFTAELNFTPSSDARGYGISLGSEFEIRVDVADEMVRAAGPGVGAIARLPRGVLHDVLHCWRLEHDGARLGVRLDGRLQFEVPFAPGLGARFSPFAEAGRLALGNCAFTRSTGAGADRAAVKPLPGRFWAGSGIDGECLDPGTSLEHELHVQRPGAVRVHLAGDFEPGDTLAVAIDDDESVVRVDRRSGLVAATLGLPDGARRLALRGVAGKPVVRLVSVLPTPCTQPETFSGEDVAGWGKRVLGACRWDDLEVSAVVTADFDAPDGHADVLVRAGQLAEGGEGADTRLGIDFLLGYSVQIHPDRVVLARHDYDTTVLGSAPAAIGRSAHEVLIRAFGSELAVELDGREILRVEDELPHPAGAVGLRTAGASLHVATLTIVPKGPTGPD